MKKLSYYFIWMFLLLFFFPKNLFWYPFPVSQKTPVPSGYICFPLFSSPVFACPSLLASAWVKWHMWRFHSSLVVSDKTSTVCFHLKVLVLFISSYSHDYSSLLTCHLRKKVVLVNEVLKSGVTWWEVEEQITAWDLVSCRFKTLLHLVTAESPTTPPLVSRAAQWEWVCRSKHLVQSTQHQHGTCSGELTFELCSSELGSWMLTCTCSSFWAALEDTLQLSLDEKRSLLYMLKSVHEGKQGTANFCAVTMFASRVYCWSKLEHHCT